MKFLVVCLNPTLQRTVVLKELRENEVNRSEECYLDASGKGVNVARVLQQLGENPIHLTHLGGANRELFLSLAKRDQVMIEELLSSTTEVRTCTTLLSLHNNTTTEIVEKTAPVEPELESKLFTVFDKIVKKMPSSTVVIISGSKAPGYSDDLYPRMVKTAKRAGAGVIIDYRGNDLINSLSYKPDCIKINAIEFASTLFPEKIDSSQLSEHQDNPDVNGLIHEKMIELYNRGIKSVVSRGALSTFFVKNGKIITLEPEKIAPRNTIGCGDAFVAGFASVYARGADMAKAVSAGHQTARKNALLVRPGRIE